VKAALRSGDATALSLVRPLADAGDPYALFVIGQMNEQGVGMPRNFRDAARFYERAAGLGETSAMTNLGLMYETGRGVPQDPLRAYVWFDLGAMTSDGARYREAAAAMLSDEQIAEAKKRAQECRIKNYRACE
jgi:hypothetical protein